MNRIWKIIVAAIFVMVVAFLEGYFSNKYLVEMENSASYLLQHSTETNFETEEYDMLVQSLDYNWKQKRTKLCYLVNYNTIKDMGVEIAGLLDAQEQGNYDLYREKLSMIRHYARAYQDIFGISIENII